ncbi:unnamed protein product [Pleuronectes platessa]|uniref:Uncharacterized protein n=1 Tax=Pleuronectes platessa TaxID=8262 RepID=A0A9N7VIF8_PLEPL|nr:unnamed protein product [Pleuronectes platessa]
MAALPPGRFSATSVISPRDLGKSSDCLIHKEHVGWVQELLKMLFTLFYDVHSLCLTYSFPTDQERKPAHPPRLSRGRQMGFVVRSISLEAGQVGNAALAPWLPDQGQLGRQALASPPTRDTVQGLQGLRVSASLPTREQGLQGTLASASPPAREQGLQGTLASASPPAREQGLQGTLASASLAAREQGLQGTLASASPPAREQGLQGTLASASPPAREQGLQGTLALASLAAREQGLQGTLA